MKTSHARRLGEARRDSGVKESADSRGALAKTKRKQCPGNAQNLLSESSRRPRSSATEPERNQTCSTQPGLPAEAAPLRLTRPRGSGPDRPLGGESQRPRLHSATNPISLEPCREVRSDQREVIQIGQEHRSKGSSNPRGLVAPSSTAIGRWRAPNGTAEGQHKAADIQAPMAENYSDQLISGVADGRQQVPAYSEPRPGKSVKRMGNNHVTVEIWAPASENRGPDSAEVKRMRTVRPGRLSDSQSISGCQGGVVDDLRNRCSAGSRCRRAEPPP